MVRGDANSGSETVSPAPQMQAGSPRRIPESGQQQRDGDVDAAECGQYGERGSGFVHGMLTIRRF